MEKVFRQVDVAAVFHGGELAPRGVIFDVLCHVGLGVFFAAHRHDEDVVRVGFDDGFQAEVFEQAFVIVCDVVRTELF